MTESHTAAQRRAFEAAEASLKLEGLDPTKDELYLSVREQIINGTMTSEQAKAYITATYLNQIQAAE